MKIQLSGVMVGQQGQALAFYAGVMGFVKQQVPTAVFDEPCGHVSQRYWVG